jgi:hypothetical protein
VSTLRFGRHAFARTYWYHVLVCMFAPRITWTCRITFRPMLTENHTGHTNQTRRHFGKNSMLTASKVDTRTVSILVNPGLFHHKNQTRHSFGKGPGFAPNPTLEYCVPAMAGVSFSSIGMFCRIVFYVLFLSISSHFWCRHGCELRDLL